LVIDEASMVDLALMAKLLEALPGHARLLLLGDKDQLASVEAGAVLGEICAQTGFTRAFADRLAQLVDVPIEAGADFPLADSIVLLKHSYRFQPRSAIGRLAELINQGNAEGVLALLAGGEHGELNWQQRSDALPMRLAAHLRARLAEYWQAVVTRAAPAEILAAFNRSRVLCAHRDGPAGALEVNRVVLRDLLARRDVDARQLWYPGRPVMILRNDYNLQLFNGDIGIALPDRSAGGELRVFLPSVEGGLRAVHPARLPEHESVYAMTIHKSQGSEFDQVLILLPSEPSPVTSRELLYTAVTRARSRVEIWASEAVLLDSVARRVRRASGLRDRLSGEALPSARC
jgi:exodeoxyribonuclease V alpha subunit